MLGVRNGGIIRMHYVTPSLLYFFINRHKSLPSADAKGDDVLRCRVLRLVEVVKMIRAEIGEEVRMAACGIVNVIAVAAPARAMLAKWPV